MTSIARLKDKARKHEQKEDWKAAIQVYQKVLQHQESQDDLDLDLGLFNRIGDLNLRIGRTDEAVAYYETAADKYAEMGFYNNAIALCNKALRHRPDRSSVYLKLSRLYSEQGFQTDARRWILKYAERQLGLGQVEKALLGLEEFAKLSDDPEVRELLADQLAAHDRPQEAVDQLRSAYTLRLRAGEREQAAELAERARAIDPDVDLEADVRASGALDRPPEKKTRSQPDELARLEPLDEPDQPEPSAEPLEGLEARPGEAEEPEVTDVEGLESAGGAREEDAESGTVEGLEPSFSEQPSPAEPAEAEPESVGGLQTFVSGSEGRVEGSGVGVEETPEEASADYDEDEEPEPLPLLEPVEPEGPDDEPIGEEPVATGDSVAAAETAEPRTAEVAEEETPPVEAAGERTGSAVAGEPVEEEAVEDETAEEEPPLEHEAVEAETAGEPVAAEAAEGRVAEDAVEAGSAAEAGAPPEAEEAAKTPDSGRGEDGGVELDLSDTEREEIVPPALDEGKTGELEPLDLSFEGGVVEQAGSLGGEGRDGVEPLDLDLGSLGVHGGTDGERSAAISAEDLDIEAVLARSRQLVSRGLMSEALRELRLLSESDAEASAFQDAMLVVNEILRHEPNDLTALQRRREYASRIGDRELEVDAVLDMADALVRLGAEPKAETLYRQALELDPANEAAREALGLPSEDAAAEEVAALLDELQPAEPSEGAGEAADPQVAAMLDQFRAKVTTGNEPEDPEDHYDLGLAFKEMGLVDEAIAEFRVALTGSEDRLKVYEELGQCFVMKGQYQTALKVLGGALRTPRADETDLLGVYYQIGQCNEALGRVEEARAAYQKVLAMDDTFADVPDRIARL